MERRFVLPAFLVVGMTALSHSLMSLAAEEAPPPGTITTVAGTGQRGFSGDGGPAVQARLNWPVGVVADATGNVIFADGQNNRIRKVSLNGTITTIAGTGVAGFSGDGGPATEARLDRPVWLALDGAGNLYFSQWAHHRVRKVGPEGLITTVVGSGPTTSEVAGDFSGDGGPATAARLDTPEGLAVDAAGNLFIADLGNQRIRKVSPDGIITTVAGTGEAGYSGDGGPATQARLNGPLGLAVDGAGNLFFTETGIGSTTSAGVRVRKVSTDGIITTVAGTGETGFSGDGGPATAARLIFPQGVAVDTAGNLFIADNDNYRVRKVDPSGTISTVAGMGRKPYAGDGVLATATGLRGPVAVAVDAAGNLLISDTGNGAIGAETDGLGYNERILKVFGAAAPGLLAGQPFPAPR
jgi:hypothetical protein